MLRRSKPSPIASRLSVTSIDDEEELVSKEEVEQQQQSLQADLEGLQLDLESLKRQLVQLTSPNYMDVFEYCASVSEPLVECFAAPDAGEEAEEAKKTRMGGLLGSPRRAGSEDAEPVGGKKSRKGILSPRKKGLISSPRKLNRWGRRSESVDSQKKPRLGLGKSRSNSIATSRLPSPRKKGGMSPRRGIKSPRTRDHPVWSKSKIVKKDDVTRTIDLEIEKNAKGDFLSDTRVLVFGIDGALIVHYMYARFANLVVSELESRLLRNVMLDALIEGGRDLVAIALELDLEVPQQVEDAACTLFEEEKPAVLRKS